LDELRISNHHVDRPHKVALRDTLRALCAKWRLRCTVTFLCRTSKSGLRNSSSRSSDSSSVIARLDHTQGEADFVLLLAQLFALVYRLPCSNEGDAGGAPLSSKSARMATASSQPTPPTTSPTCWSACSHPARPRASPAAC